MVTPSPDRTGSPSGLSRASASTADRSEGAWRARKVHQPRASKRRPSDSARLAKFGESVRSQWFVHHLAIAILGGIELCLASPIIACLPGLPGVPRQYSQPIHGPRVMDGGHELFERASLGIVVADARRQPRA